MPGISLQLSGSRDEQLARRLVSVLTELTCGIFKKEAERTSVRLSFLSHDDWFINQRSLTDLGVNAFFLEVTVTDETTTKDQKAAFHKAVFHSLSEVIGNIHPLSGIHVIDCRGAAYGYGGVTQEYHAHH